MTKTASFYFDFISPYSYVASQLIEKEPRFAALPLVYRPVAFGSMLSHYGTKGPGEIPSRRKIGLQDVILLCQRYGIPLAGPPTHPFNSVYALRSVCDVADPALAGALTRRYFLAAWGEGRGLDDLAVLRECLAELGIEQDPEESASKRECRKALKTNTKDALGEGAWGVPSFVVDGHVFFGHDRLELLASYLDGDLDLDQPKLEALLARPQPGRIT